MPWVPWQLVQTATSASPWLSRLLCWLMRYFAYWSVGRLGLYLRMYAGSAWQRAQNWGMSARAGRPMKPFVGSPPPPARRPEGPAPGGADPPSADASGGGAIAASGSMEVGSPPWQSAQERPRWMWMSWSMTCVGADTLDSNALWHSTQLSAASARADRTMTVPHTSPAAHPPNAPSRLLGGPPRRRRGSSRPRTPSPTPRSPRRPARPVRPWRDGPATAPARAQHRPPP